MKPQNLKDVIYPNDATKFLVESIGSGDLKKHVILYGPRGTAKTTTANLLAEAVGGSNPYIETDFQKIMAQPDIKFYLKQSCARADLFHHSKCILIFNEFDNYKKPVHEFWEATDHIGTQDLMVIITTNELMDIHPSLRSRYETINFPAITATQFLTRAQLILQSKGITLPDAQVLYYLKTVERFGDLRKYLDLLDQLQLICQRGMTLPPWANPKPTLTVV